MGWVVAETLGTCLRGGESAESVIFCFTFSSRSVHRGVATRKYRHRHRTRFYLLHVIAFIDTFCSCALTVHLWIIETLENFYRGLSLRFHRFKVLRLYVRTIIARRVAGRIYTLAAVLGTISKINPRRGLYFSTVMMRE